MVMMMVYPLSTGRITGPAGISLVPDARHGVDTVPAYAFFSQHLGAVSHDDDGTPYAHLFIIISLMGYDWYMVRDDMMNTYAVHSFVLLHNAQHNDGSADCNTIGYPGKSSPGRSIPISIPVSGRPG